MSRIQVEPNHLQSFASDVRRKQHDIESLTRSLSRAMRLPDWEGSSHRRVERAWKTEKKKLGRLSEETGRLATYLDHKSSVFLEADRMSLADLGGVWRDARPYPDGKTFPVVGIPKQPVCDWRDLGQISSDPEEIENSTPIVQIPPIDTEPYRPEGDLIDFLHYLKWLFHGLGHIDPKFHAAYYALLGGLSIYENWHDHADEGAIKIATASIMDALLELALSEGARWIVTGMFTAIGGPLGTQVGLLVGGMLGHYAGEFGANLIKETEWWKSAVDTVADFVTDLIKQPSVTTVMVRA